MMRNLKHLILTCLISSVALVPAYAYELKDNETSGVLTVYNRDIPVLSYCYGDQLKPGVDPKYTRSCYIHPIYSWSGEPITDDFPEDHPHHRGLSWTWPYVEVGTTKTQTWHPASPSLRQHFSKWIEKKADDKTATITVENKWLLDEKEVVALETVKITTPLSPPKFRDIGISITIQAINHTLKLKGTNEGNKGYGGLGIRMAPEFKGASLSTDTGVLEKDVVYQPFKWVRISNEIAILKITPSDDHPDFPPKWMARNSYAGFINVSWPGLSAIELNPDESITLNYRIGISDARFVSHYRQPKKQ